jgi:hypothetical protein
MRSEPSTRMRSEPSPISSPACRPTSDHVCLGSFAYLASSLAYRLPYAYRSHQIRLPSIRYAHIKCIGLGGRLYAFQYY